jgi:hypothetical protein
VFSSSKLERATYDSVAFRFIAANDHPDHDTIATFRRRLLKEIEKLFVDVLRLAGEIGEDGHDGLGLGSHRNPAATCRRTGCPPAIRLDGASFFRIFQAVYLSQVRPGRGLNMYPCKQRHFDWFTPRH